MPVDINRLTEGWLELESDPGIIIKDEAQKLNPQLKALN